ncbi:MAG: signal recognition particle-docking protein FtsY [candidate division Zixibacteria bacterium]|nr:signal recognition particle-docking protein FtsY [candidate division Zixibacteria bacterium]
MGFSFEKLKAGLTKTRQSFFGKVREVLGVGGLDEATLSRLEEILVGSDLGVATAERVLSHLKEETQRSGIARDREQVLSLLKSEIKSIVVDNGSPGDFEESLFAQKPSVVLVLGVNGTGKTTSIGKLARRFAGSGKKVLVAASDTFRAAAIEQLELWAKRSGADFVKAASGQDPASVAFDAVSAAQKRGTDIVLVDTAGRLHTKTNLMEELKKVKRVIGKALPGAPHEVWLVLDATVGQNGLLQAKTFHQDLGVTGVVLTKLDGTAKGGIVLAIASELGVKVRYIGIGEKLEDLELFDPEDFVEALFA